MNLSSRLITYCLMLTASACLINLSMRTLMSTPLEIHSVSTRQHYNQTSVPCQQSQTQTTTTCTYKNINFFNEHNLLKGADSQLLISLWLLFSYAFAIKTAFPNRLEKPPKFS